MNLPLIYIHIFYFIQSNSPAFALTYFSVLNGNTLLLYSLKSNVCELRNSIAMFKFRMTYYIIGKTVQNSVSTSSSTYFGVLARHIPIGQRRSSTGEISLYVIRSTQLISLVAVPLKQNQIFSNTIC